MASEGIWGKGTAHTDTGMLCHGSHMKLETNNSVYCQQSVYGSQLDWNPVCAITTQLPCWDLLMHQDIAYNFSC